MSVAFLGEIRLLPYNFAPRGWMDCSGQLLPIAQYDALFSLIGTIYGGDGQTTFALPDMRGRLPLHQGTAQTGTSHTIGEQSGFETVTLNTQQMPGHSHNLSASANSATALIPSNSLLPGSVAGDTFYVTDINGALSTAMSAQAITASGSSQPHTNTMPSLTIRFCIAVEGIYPSRN